MRIAGSNHSGSPRLEIADRGVSVAAWGMHHRPAAHVAPTMMPNANPPAMNPPIVSAAPSESPPLGRVVAGGGC